MAKQNDLPTPVTANQKFLAKAAGMDVELPTAITMDQMYLQAIAEVSGGGSGDSYTKAETDQLLDGKADLVDGKVPASELPSYVDDTVEGYYYQGAFYEDSEHTITITGETGKIYIDLTTNKSYRWTGTVYVRIDECPAFGETQGTIYEGNKGKQNADAIAAIKDGTNIDSFADVETALALKANTADIGTAATADTTTSITSGGTGLPTSGTVYTDQKRQDTEIGSLVDRGAKNLLHVDNVYVLSMNGVTFTANPDGTISTSGTATGASYCSLALGGYYESNQVYIGRFCDGNHILSGCPSGGNYSSGYSMYAASGTYNVIDEGNGVLLDSSVITNIRIIIMIRQGTNADGLVFKPMICTKEDYAISPEFAPYAPTNRELYETGPRKKVIRHNFTTSDYEEIPECSVTIPQNKTAFIVACLTWNNSAPRGIKMSIGSISQSDKVFGITESENNYGGITAYGLLTNTNDTTVRIYAKSNSAGGNDVTIFYWIL